MATSSIGVDTPAAERRFGVQIDPLEHDRLSIEKDAGALDPDVAEADFILQPVLSGC